MIVLANLKQFDLSKRAGAMKRLLIAFAAIIFLLNASLFAWLYPEHRDIALLAIQNLSPRHRAILDRMWADARKGYETRLTLMVIDTSQSVAPEKIDYPAWSAIAGDHSCSPQIMLDNILKTEWLIDVADIAAQLKIDLAESGDRYEHINAIRDSDIKFQRADPFYATRAGSNNAHFLISRPEVDTGVREYLTACLVEGTEINALAVYSLFHINAIMKASLLQDKRLSDEERSAISLSALADEGFALHFLEDVFASGHVAGTWGDASQRKGTHDYYNENGLATTTWNGKKVILTGDAYMRHEDAVLAAETIQHSLEQVLDVANGKIIIIEPGLELENAKTPDRFNVCKNNFVPGKEIIDKQIVDMLGNILVQTPVPGMSTGLGELPRFRAELGPFIGVSPALHGAGLNGGFGLDQTTPGASGGIDVAIRLGIGLEGVLNESGDGLIFLDFGWRQDGSATMKYGDSPSLAEAGQITSAIPGREAFITRLRMPFWLLPLDMIILAPTLLLVSPDDLPAVGVQAVNGGLIPWQSGIATPVGRFQFILGREIGVSFFGRKDQNDVILIPNQGSGENETILVDYESTQFDFPIIEYRPFRTFSIDQSSSMIIQMSFGVDIPNSARVIAPDGAQLPELKNVWYLGLRFGFDWRYYFN